MPRTARRRKPPADVEPISEDDLHAIAAFCGYTLVNTRRGTWLYDNRTGKTCLRGAIPVVDHLRALGVIAESISGGSARAVTARPPKLIAPEHHALTLFPNAKVRAAVQVLANERRRSAIHEAGHIVVARKLGVTALGWIFPRYDPGPNDKSWAGKSTLFLKTTKRQRRMIGVAGAIAEIGWSWPWHEGREQEACALDTDILANFMSETDWQLTGRAPGKLTKQCIAAINEVESLLRRDTGELWPELIRTARALIIQSRVWADQEAAA